jgi:hypothetical protein
VSLAVGSCHCYQGWRCASDTDFSSARKSAATILQQATCPAPLEKSESSARTCSMQQAGKKKQLNPNKKRLAERQALKVC